MKGLLIGGSMLAASFAHAEEDASFLDNFEAPTYQEGASVHGINAWEVADPEPDDTKKAGVETDLIGGIASGTQVFEGSQSLEVKAGGEVRREVAGNGIRFLDVFVLPVYAADNGGTALNVAGGGLAFAKSGSTGRVTVYSGTDTGAKPVGEEYSLVDEQGAGEAWVRVTVRVDHKLGTWDLFLDGRPVKADLALGEGRGVFQVVAPTEGAIYADCFRESAENPLFEDKDSDGMPDAEEKAYGLDPYLNDREGDLDGDGVKNAAEFFEGSSPRASWSGLGKFVFVDNRNGRDSNTGKTSQPGMGSDGPMASIKAAMEAAASGDIIVVMKGTGIYEEGSRSAEGKKLTIKIVAPVTIR